MMWGVLNWDLYKRGCKKTCSKECFVQTGVVKSWAVQIRGCTKRVLWKGVLKMGVMIEGFLKQKEVSYKREVMDMGV